METLRGEEWVQLGYGGGVVAAKEEEWGQLGKRSGNT